MIWSKQKWYMQIISITGNWTWLISIAIISRNPPVSYPDVTQGEIFITIVYAIVMYKISESPVIWLDLTRSRGKQIIRVRFMLPTSDFPESLIKNRTRGQAWVVLPRLDLTFADSSSTSIEFQAKSESRVATLTRLEVGRVIIWVIRIVFPY